MWMGTKYQWIPADEILPVKPVSGIKKWMVCQVTVTALAMGVMVWFSPWGKTWDLFTLDMLFKIRGPRAPTPDIVIVGIDEPSFAVIGKQWPWPRRIHAQLISTLIRNGARVIALDLLFPEASNPQQDQLLSQAIASHPGTVLAVYIDQKEEEGYVRQIIVGPNPLLNIPDDKLGYINLPLDEDGVIRRVNLRHDGLQAFALRASSEFKHDLYPKPSVGDAMLINFSGPPHTIRTVSYYQALEAESHLPAGFFHDKLVFIGFSTQGSADPSKKLPDYFPVPYSRGGGGYMAGVEIHAQIAGNLIRQHFLREIEYRVLFSIAAVFWSLSLYSFIWLRPLLGGSIASGSWMLVSIFSYFLFVRFSLYLPPLFFLIPSSLSYFASILIRYLQTRQEKVFIRNAFSTYLAPSVVQELMKSPEKLSLGGQEVDITAFFSDLEGFTVISESLGPAELVALLNTFLTEMTDILLRHGGTVDKFEGDAIIAFFGAPHRLEQHARVACETCLEMQARLSHLRKDWARNQKPLLKMRIGLNSGLAVVGNMGTKKRMDYTMMGDTVNTAARLEGISKIYGTYTLIGESTYRAAGNGVVCREIDTVTVVGKSDPLRIYELLGLEGTVPRHILETIRFYEEGLRAYYRGKWDEALRNLYSVLKYTPCDSPSIELINRCQRYQKKPPDRDWRGVYIAKTK